MEGGGFFKGWHTGFSQISFVIRLGPGDVDGSFFVEAEPEQVKLGTSSGCSPRSSC